MLTPYVIRGLQTKAAVRYHELAISTAQTQYPCSTNRLWWCRVTGTLIHCWWERERVQPLRKSAGQLRTTLNSLAMWPSGLASPHLPKWTKNLQPHKRPYANLYGSFIYNRQNLEATELSFIRWVDKPTVEYDSLTARNELPGHNETGGVVSPHQEVKAAHLKSQSSWMIPALWH